jgi:CRISPR system Cascade subunit CasC
MKAEIHVLQNFASSNLNRDDTGTPKDCDLGGVRRARVSSQCLKRAMREAFETLGLVPPSDRAARTKRLVEHAAAIVSETKGVDADRAQRAVAAALAGGGIKADDDKGWKTQYLLFVPSRLIGRLANIVVAHFDALSTDSRTPKPDDEASDAAKTGNKAGKVTAKRAKADAKAAVPEEVAVAVKELLADAARTPELALFGRMIADEPKWNVEAACQVAHAVSTHRVSMEFDFYTAIDDLKKDDTAGSDMMGTISFNSACFYRYLVVDVEALARNLGNDETARTQARQTLAALIRAAVLAIPTGKQNSMAAHNLPSFVLVDVREGAQPRSLTNAFIDPVRPKPGPGGDLVSQSIEKLGKHYVALERVYGSHGRRDHSFILVDEAKDVRAGFADHTKATDRGTLDGLIAASVDAAFRSAT